MKKSSIIIVAIFIGILAWLFLDPIIAVPKDKLARQDLASKISTVEIARQNIKVEVVDTDTKRQLGLSGHAPLADNQGMLFVFDQPAKYGFWMKDMTFPLDIIWFSSDLPLTKGEVGGGRVIYIEKNLQPSSYPNSFGPDQNSLYVLEVNAGFSDKNNLKIGDEVKFK
ncbi:MAG: DUF192 domain-containing protein [Candidatus Nomurabacteria bacterium]|nr:DUF192 domain-containing protein [Candidatus Nomurabacteria bacterium]